jgi:hypothetical protein
VKGVLVYKNLAVAGLSAPESVNPRDLSGANLPVLPSEKTLPSDEQAGAPADALRVAIDSLMRVSGIGLRRESDRASYATALEAVLQAARDAGRQDLFDASRHIADNLTALHSRPETRAAALLPLLDFPGVMSNWFEQPNRGDSTELLLACLADPAWPLPLATAAMSRLRALFVQAGADAREAPPVASACASAAR